MDKRIKIAIAIVIGSILVLLTVTIGYMMSLKYIIDEISYPIQQEKVIKEIEEKTTKETSKEKNDKVKISEKEAIEVALNHAGVGREEVSFLWVEQDFDDGTLNYEIEFHMDGIEYSYDIDAVSGKIIEFDMEHGD